MTDRRVSAPHCPRGQREGSRVDLIIVDEGGWRIPMAAEAVPRLFVRFVVYGVVDAAAASLSRRSGRGLILHPLDRFAADCLWWINVAAWRLRTLRCGSRGASQSPCFSLRQRSTSRDVQSSRTRLMSLKSSIIFGSIWPR